MAVNISGSLPLKQNKRGRMIMLRDIPIKIYQNPLNTPKAPGRNIFVQEFRVEISMSLRLKHVVRVMPVEKE